MIELLLNSAVKKELSKVSEAASYMWEKGWAERNGGNISINLTDIFDNFTIPSSTRLIPVRNYPKEAANMVIWVTGTGERLRELRDPARSSCIVKFNPTATGFYIIWGGKDKPGMLPTSELISHVKIHVDKVKNKSPHRTVLHTHPIELIAMSHHPDLTKDENEFNNIIWSMFPEVRIFVPNGVALCKYTLPGSEKLADITVEALRTKDVAIWLKHGVIAAGRDILSTFDTIDIVNKACRIYLDSLSAGFKPVGLSDKEMKEIADTFIRKIK